MIAVSPMALADVPACLGVIARCWDPLTAQMAQDDLRAMFLAPRFAPTFYVARGRVDASGEHDTIQGLSGHVTSCKNWGVLDLIYVAVRPEVQRQGVGARLVRRCLADADAIDCAVMLTTFVPSFYQPMGFETLAAGMVCAGKPNALMLRRCRSERAECTVAAGRNGR